MRRPDDLLLETGKALRQHLLPADHGANVQPHAHALAACPRTLTRLGPASPCPADGDHARLHRRAAILGCIIDSVSILLLTMPIMVPIALKLGYDKIWFGMIAIVAIEIGLLTPPFGMVVFAMKAALPDGRADRGNLPRVCAVLRPSCCRARGDHLVSASDALAAESHVLAMSGILLVTGGSRGIGAATARLAAARGYAVCINYRANRAAAEASSTRSRQPAEGDRRAADVGIEADVVRLFETDDASSAGSPRWSTTPASSSTQMRVDEMTRRACTACSRPMSSAASSARAKRCGACRPGAAARRRDRQRVVGRGAPRRARRVRRLRRLEGAHRHVHDRSGQGSGRRGHPRQRRAPGRHLHRDPRQRRRAGPRRAGQGAPCRCAAAEPTRSRGRSSGCSPTKRRTRRARSSTSPAAASFSR